MYLDTPSVFLTKVSLYNTLNFIRLLDLYNCKLVDTNFKFQNSSNLLEKFIVITITGTIAIERALNGYKTIICGNPYFKDMPGLIHIEKLKSPNDIYEIDFGYDENIKKESKYFLKELLENSTLENPFGIGTGKKYESSFEEMKFFLLSQIKKNKSIINED